MVTVDRLMEPYVNAASLEEAEQVLDGLVDEGDVPGDVLGECYDDLAESAAQEKDYSTAVRLERKAVAIGCANRRLAREMLGWYLLGDGRIDEGEQAFAELRREAPGDADLLIGLGHARSEAHLQDAALEAFDEAVAIAKLAGYQKILDRARIERRAEREHVGLPADDDDRLAPQPRPLTSNRTVWSLAWFPPDQHAPALARWPDLAEDLADPITYSTRIEGHLTRLLEATGQRPSVAPIDVEDLVGWADEEGYDPNTGEARSLFATELTKAGRSVAWPPGRNDPCWCRSGRKYKRCCGAR